jgi:hypothetical protein
MRIADTLYYRKDNVMKNYLYSAIAISVLAGCSGNMASTPGATVSNAALPSVATQDGSGSGFNMRKLGFETVALQTVNGNYVTAAGPPITEPNCGSGQVALHDDATRIGPDEKFTMVNEGNNVYAFRLFQTHYYITAVNGGGMAGPNQTYGYSQLHTDATSVGPWEIFRIIRVGRYVALETDWKTYVTAMPNCGGTNTVPFHTDATKVGPWEKFTLVSE